MNTIFFKSIFFTILLINSSVYCQSEMCDTIYQEVDSDAKYSENNSNLLTYFTEQLVPIINRNYSDDSEILSLFIMKLTIDKNGKIIDAEFPKNDLSITCKEELKKKLLTMTGWKPSQKNGKNVCSNFVVPFRICLQ